MADGEKLLCHMGTWVLRLRFLMGFTRRFPKNKGSPNFGKSDIQSLIPVSCNIIVVQVFLGGRRIPCIRVKYGSESSAGHKELTSYYSCGSCNSLVRKRSFFLLLIA